MADMDMKGQGIGVGGRTYLYSCDTMTPMPLKRLKIVLSSDVKVLKIVCVSNLR
jgi:hypothetical protein